MGEPNNINCKYLTINFIKREKGNIFIEILPFLNLMKAKELGLNVSPKAMKAICN